MFHAEQHIKKICLFLLPPLTFRLLRLLLYESTTISKFKCYIRDNLVETSHTIAATCN